MKKIYVGCGLTHAPEEYRKEIERFKELLRKEGFEVLDFIWAILKDPRDVTPKKVYEFDIKGCVEECDFMVAVCDEPSLGCGYEMAVAIEKLNKPVLALIKRGGKLTRLIEGIQHPKYSLEEYDSFEHAVKLVIEKSQKY